MSWNQLLNIYKEFAKTRQFEDSARPTSCPRCGEPLEAKQSQLHCPFDGYTWPEGISR